MGEIIQYHKITLEDRAMMTKKYEEDPQRICEHCFANNYLWQNIYPAEVAEFDRCISVRFWDGADLYYDFPVGLGDKRRAMDRIISWTDRQETLRLYGLVQQEVDLIEQWYPGYFHITEDRNYFDYIYETKRLTTLSGKKLHGKRNHIHRFKENPDWRYESLSAHNWRACMEMNRLWKRKRSDKWDDGMEEEFQVVNHALQNFEALGMVGGVLWLGDQIVAFTMGEPLGGDTFAVHFEKAFPEVQGAYPMINQQFVEHECQSYRYINREDDAGSEGLRRAKMSYGPDILLKKYMAERRK
ncbi:MAG: DUF2156 domain-containing protein [Lachnospiraceae bacterium]|nr:DUF2156 domain-containing protein [Lachnospiraceae bacterium]